SAELAAVEPYPHPVEEPAPVPSTPPRAPRPLSRPDLSLPALPRARPPARAWSFGAALLTLVLAAELVYAYRSPLAQRYPILRPWLESACVAAGCAVSWAREDALLKLEDS